MIKKILCMIKENNAMHIKYKTQIRIEALPENSFSEDLQITSNKNKTAATLFDVWCETILQTIGASIFIIGSSHETFQLTVPLCFNTRIFHSNFFIEKNRYLSSFWITEIKIMIYQFVKNWKF